MRTWLAAEIAQTCFWHLEVRHHCRITFRFGTHSTSCTPDKPDYHVPTTIRSWWPGNTTKAAYVLRPLQIQALFCQSTQNKHNFSHSRFKDRKETVREAGREGGREGEREREMHACCMPKSTGWYKTFCLWSSIFLPSVLQAALWWFVWHICHCPSLALNRFGLWVLFLSKAGLLHYSHFAATLNSYWSWLDWCESQTVHYPV